MAAYMLDVLSHHQSNILFLVFSCDIEIILNTFFYDQTFQCSLATVTYHFTRLRELPVTCFRVICKYFQNSEDRGLLGYPIQYSQREITLRNLE